MYIHESVIDSHLELNIFTCETTMSLLGPLSAPGDDYIQNLFSHKQIPQSLAAESH